MRRIVVHGALFAALVLPACGADTFTSDDAAAIRATMQAQQTAWNAGDIDAFMTGYHATDEVVFTSGAKIRRGYNATLAAYRNRYVDGDAKMGTLAFSDLEITGLSATSAVVLGHWALTDTPQAGGGVFSLVFTEVDGVWKIVHDHSSAAERS